MVLRKNPLSFSCISEPSMKGTFENPRRDIAELTTKELKTVVNPKEWFYRRKKGGEMVLRVWWGKPCSLESFLRYKADWKGRCVRASRQYDRARGMVCKITEDDIQSMWEKKQKCHYCDVLMTTDDRLKNKNGLTVERLDNNFGHSPENCVLACKDCNVTLHISAVIEKMEQNEHLREYMFSKILEMQEA